MLKGLIAKSLEEADRKQMPSIAFTAIGTGNLLFPPGQVAEIYFDEVTRYSQKHPETSLIDVRFVLHDNSTLHAFQAVERRRHNNESSSVRKDAEEFRNQRDENGASSNGSSASSPVKILAPDHLETTVGSICFQVQYGNITEESTDAIAIISNQLLDLSNSGSGAAILRSGGDSIKNECSKLAPQNPGSIVVTAAGNLKARFLFHIVPPVSLDFNNLKAVLVKCLHEAEKKGISSISFPAVGTGNLGLSAKSSVSAMLGAILEVSKEKPKLLKLVKMTIFQKSLIKDIRLAMEEASNVNPLQDPPRSRNVVGKGLKSVAGDLGTGGNEASTNSSPNAQIFDDKRVDLIIFAGSKSELNKTKKAVSKMMREKCKLQQIENEVVKRMTEEDMKKIHDLELRYSVEIVVKKPSGRIAVEGLSDDLRQVTTEFIKMFQEIDERSHAEMVSKNIQWKYRAEGKLEEYDGHLNAQIELAFQQEKSAVIIKNEKGKYEIDLISMTQKDETGNATEVRRFDLRKGTQTIFFIMYLLSHLDLMNGAEGFRGDIDCSKRPIFNPIYKTDVFSVAEAAGLVEGGEGG